jgi:uncharacterized membrane protein YfcA
MLLSFPVLGLLAGVLAGMFGIGGGLVIVPALSLIFGSYELAPDYRMHLAIGTSLGTIIFTSVSSMLAHHRKGAILWPTALRLVPGIIAGGFLGAAIADAVSNRALGGVFGLFVVTISLYMVIGRRPEAGGALPGLAGHTLAGIVIGTVSALTGIGGGAVTNPFLLWRGVNIRNSVATSAACTLPVAMASACGFLLAGLNTPGLPAGSTGYIYWPAVAGISVGSVLTAPLGAHLAHTVPVEQLRRAFAVLLLFVGIRMFWRGFS